MTRKLSGEEYLEYLFMAREADSHSSFSLFATHDMMWRETFREEISECLAQLPEKRLSREDYLPCDADRYITRFEDICGSAADAILEIEKSVARIGVFSAAWVAEDILAGTSQHLKRVDILGSESGDAAISAGDALDLTEKKITELTVALEAERIWLYGRFTEELQAEEYTLPEEVPSIETVFPQELVQRLSEAEELSRLCEELFVEREKLRELYSATLGVSALLVGAARDRLPYLLGRIAEASGLPDRGTPYILLRQSVKDLLQECEKVRKELGKYSATEK